MHIYSASARLLFARIMFTSLRADEKFLDTDRAISAICLLVKASVTRLVYRATRPRNDSRERSRCKLLLAISKVPIAHNRQTDAIMTLKQARCTAARCELRFRADEPQKRPLHSLRRWGRRTRKCCMCTCMCMCVRCTVQRRLRFARALRLTLRAADWAATGGRGPTQSFTPCTSYAVANLYHLPAKW